MLIQSHTKYIDLLPALPAAFAGGSVNGLCARGGFVFDMQWKNGKLTAVAVKSKAGGDCLLRYNGITKLIKTIRGKIYRINGNLEVVK